MREYETMYILHPSLSEADQKKIGDKCEAIITRHEGKTFRNLPMGKRTLAYAIKKQTRGTYFCLDYTAKGGVVNEIEQQFKLDENVLRFLTTVRQKEVDVEARLLEIATQKEQETVAVVDPVKLQSEKENAREKNENEEE